MKARSLSARQVRLAVAPIAWINDDIEELSKIYTIKQCISESSEAGYVGVEAGRAFPTDAEVLQPMLANSGLVLASGWWSGMLRTGSLNDEIKRIDDYLRLFNGCGAEIMFYGEVDGSIQAEELPLSQRPTLSVEEFKSYGERLTALARHTHKHGVRLCYHHHMGTVVQTAEDVDLLMANTGRELGLLVDSGHIVFAGGDPAKLVSQYAKRVVYIHCKDLRQDRLETCLKEDWHFMRAVREGVFTVPGDGFIDFDVFIGKLAEVGYRGWIVVEAEQDPRVANPKQYAIMGREHLESLLDRHGMQVFDELRRS